MTALGKLFGATAFRLALAILVLSAVGAGVVLYIIAWQVESVVDREIARTIDAESQGLIDAFDNAGIRRLEAVIEARKREPGSLRDCALALLGCVCRRDVSGVP